MSEKKVIGKELRGSGGLRTHQNMVGRAGDDESQHNY
jgi:hypothetical protein